jgi:hypothetical protein
MLRIRPVKVRLELLMFHTRRCITCIHIRQQLDNNRICPLSKHLRVANYEVRNVIRLLVLIIRRFEVLSDYSMGHPQYHPSRVRAHYRVTTEIARPGEGSRPPQTPQ